MKTTITTTSTIIAIAATTARNNKNIEDRIYVFDSVLLGKKKPGDMIKRGNKTLKIYGIIRGDEAVFENNDFGDKYIKYVFAGGSMWMLSNETVCCHCSYPDYIGHNMLDWAKKDIAMIDRCGMTVMGIDCELGEQAAYSGYCRDNRGNEKTEEFDKKLEFIIPATEDELPF